MYLVQYGATLTGSNLDGSDLTVDAFSDTTGGTTSATVTEGDYVMDVQLVDGKLVGQMYLVRDGSAWEEQNIGATPGDLYIAVSPDVPFQRGTLFVFLDSSQEFVVVNQAMTIAIAEAIAGV